MPSWTADGRGILATRTTRSTRANDLVRVDADSGVLAALGIDGAHARELGMP
jgi:hypothetical protein